MRSSLASRLGTLADAVHLPLLSRSQMPLAEASALPAHAPRCISFYPSSSGSSTVHSESKTARPSSQLVYKVLRAFILGTVKTIDIAWSELTSKQHLQDGEDFSSDKNGLSLFESTDTGYVIAELEDALEWIQSQSESQSGPLLLKDVESLKARMNFRKQMLHAVRLLQSPAEAAPLDVVMHAKFARRNWASLRPADDVQPSESHSSARDTIPDRNADTNSTAALPLHRPDRNAAPSLAAAASFDPAYNRRLAWCQALRPSLFLIRVLPGACWTAS